MLDYTTLTDCITLLASLLCWCTLLYRTMLSRIDHVVRAIVMEQNTKDGVCVSPEFYDLL